MTSRDAQLRLRDALMLCPDEQSTVTVLVDDLAEVLAALGKVGEEREKLANAVRLAESFIARVAHVPAEDLALYRSVLDQLASVMASTGVEVARDDPLMV